MNQDKLIEIQTLMGKCRAMLNELSTEYFDVYDNSNPNGRLAIAIEYNRNAQFCDIAFDYCLAASKKLTEVMDT